MKWSHLFTIETMKDLFIPCTIFLQDNELIEKILKKASLAQSSLSTSHTASSTVTKEIDSHSSTTISKNLENEEDEEEEEIDDDEEAL